MCVCVYERGVLPLFTHTHRRTHPPPHTSSPQPPQHYAPTAIDGVSELRGDVLINLDTLGIDLTSCCNDLLVCVKDHCLSGPQLMRWACLIVMETIITAELGRGSLCGSLYFSLCHKHTVSNAHMWPHILICLLRELSMCLCLNVRYNTPSLNRQGSKGKAIIGVNICLHQFYGNHYRLMDWLRLRKLNNPKTAVSFTCLQALWENYFKCCSSLIY